MQRVAGGRRLPGRDERHLLSCCGTALATQLDRRKQSAVCVLHHWQTGNCFLNRSFSSSQRNSAVRSSAEPLMQPKHLHRLNIRMRLRVFSAWGWRCGSWVVGRGEQALLASWRCILQIRPDMHAAMIIVAHLGASRKLSTIQADSHHWQH